MDIKSPAESESMRAGIEIEHRWKESTSIGSMAGVVGVASGTSGEKGCRIFSSWQAEMR